MITPLNFVIPTSDMLSIIADNMRQSDIEEVIAAGNDTPLQALEESVEYSKTSVVACHGDVPLVIYGLSRPTVLGNGVIWMLGTNQSKKFRREFMHYTRLVIAEMLTECSMLYNYVHARNTVSIRWLKALGFTIEDAEQRGPYNELFHKFYIERT